VDVKDQLVFSANQNIVFLNIAKTYPELIFSKKDAAEVSVLDLSLDGKYLVSGMKSGEITLWQINSQITQNGQNTPLFIILGCSIGGLILVIIVACIIRRYFCKAVNGTNED
jgi:hypothetical protein